MWKTGGGRGVEFYASCCQETWKVLFFSCSKMAAVGNKKRMFVVIWFTSPCSSVFTAQRLIDGGNIWLLCIAQRGHIYYTWHSVHLPETQPACSSISANTRTRDKHTLSLLLASSQATQMPDHIFLWYQMRIFFQWTVCYYVSMLIMELFNWILINEQKALLPS